MHSKQLSGSLLFWGKRQFGKRKLRRPIQAAAILGAALLLLALTSANGLTLIYCMPALASNKLQECSEGCPQHLLPSTDSSVVFQRNTHLRQNVGTWQQQRAAKTSRQKQSESEKDCFT